jgi:hypothetical protein
LKFAWIMHASCRDVLWAAALVLVAELVSCSSDSAVHREAPAVDPRFELFTIVGEVALKSGAPGDTTGPWGRWNVAREDAAPAPLTDAERERLSDVAALPYVQGSMPAPASTGVTVHDRERAHDGLNVYNSGHGPHAFVMDMAGNALHSWTYESTDVWPDAPRTGHGEFWRRVYAYPDGDLLAIFEGIGMIKLDRESRLQWAFKGWCHHEAVVADDGRIYVLTRRGQMVPRLSESRPVLVDYITILDADGHLLSEHSLLECVENSPHRDLLRGARKGGDIFHTNSIHILDGSLAGDDPAFADGNVLVSMRKIDVLAVVDIVHDRVVWASSGHRRNGFWAKQHDPQPLPSGDFLLFDNLGNRGRSRAVEFDPHSNDIVWQYAGDTDDPLWSRTCGAASRLPNGNTLITESDAGRALEVTPGLEVVWEFYNPYRAGDGDELIATLFELERVPRDYFSWIESE